MDLQVNPELYSLRLRQRLQGDATITASVQDTIIIVRNTLKIQETLMLNYESYSKDFYRAFMADSVPVITV